jgi:hypothetical protein
MPVDIRAVGSRLFQRLKHKSRRYWVSALIVFILTLVGSTTVYEHLGLRQKRAEYFQFLMDHGRRSTEPRYVSLFLIEDDEYWYGEPAGRAPLDRRYLARVVENLVTSNTRVIALDIDARLPNPKKMTIPKEYKDETCKLIGAIKAGVGAGKKFVLATPISLDKQKRYRQDTDIYQANSLCERPEHGMSTEKPCGIAFEPHEKSNVTCGYIALPYDPLAVPLQIAMADGRKLDSFALAIARAEHPHSVNVLLGQSGGGARYTNFISEKKIKDFGASFSAGAFLRSVGPKNLHPAVIVGANWHEFAFTRGLLIDLHPTPIGDLVGAVLHANFAEALLDSRTIGALPEWVTHGAEVMLSVIAALIFALIAGFWKKVGVISSTLIVLFLVQWAMLDIFGVFFDAFFPVLGLGLHSLYERLLGMHEAWTPNHGVIEGA